MGSSGSKQQPEAGGAGGASGDHAKLYEPKHLQHLSAAEISLLIVQTPPEQLCKIFKRKLSSASREAILEQIVCKGLTTARAKAALVQALNRTDLDAKVQRALESLFTSTRGEELTLMKSLVETGRKAVSLQYLLFNRLRDTQCAATIIRHIKSEADAVVQTNAQRGRSALRLLKVISDIDDTFICMTRDPTYPKTCLYPGVLDFYAALHNPAYSGVPSYLHDAYAGGADKGEERDEGDEGEAGKEAAGRRDPLSRTQSVPQYLADGADGGVPPLTDLSAEGPLTPRTMPQHTGIPSFEWAYTNATSSLAPPAHAPEQSGVPAPSPLRLLRPPAPASSVTRHHRSRSDPPPILPLATPPRPSGASSTHGAATPPKAPGSVRSSHSSSSSGLAASGGAGASRARQSPRAAAIRDSLYVTFITARPKMYRKGYYWLTLRQLRRTGLEHVTVLPGSMASVLGGVAGKRDKKVANFGEYRELFGEFAFVFVGDSGECDVDVARLLLQRHPASTAAALIHDVTNTGPEERAALRAKGIVYYDTYVGAALEALSLGLFNAVCSCGAADGPQPALCPPHAPHLEGRSGPSTPTRGGNGSPVPLPFAFPQRSGASTPPGGPASSSRPPSCSPVPMPRVGPDGAVAYARFQHAPACRCVATALRVARAAVRDHARVSFGLSGQRKRAEALLARDLELLNALAPPEERVDLPGDRRTAGPSPMSPPA